MMGDSTQFDKWIPLMTAGVAAFLGAIFAFFVSQANERVKRHRKRWAMHMDGLVMLNYRLNEIIGVTADNRHVAETIIDSASEGGSHLPVTWLEPNALQRGDPRPVDLLRVDLLHSVYSYYEKIRKLNDDTETLFRAYREWRAARIRNDIQDVQYRRSLSELGSGLRKSTKSYDLMDRRTVDLAARTRAILNADKRHDSRCFLRWWWGMPKQAEITRTSIETERESMIAEVRETQELSRMEIEQYLS